jgi:hypothetical protein
MNRRGNSVRTLNVMLRIELLGPFDDPQLLSPMYVIYRILSVYAHMRLSVVKKFDAVAHLLKGQTFGGQHLCIVCNSTVILSTGFVVNMRNFNRRYAVVFLILKITCFFSQLYRAS